MITPAEAAYRLLVSGLLGVGLGLAYDFCLGLRSRTLGDLLFLPFLVWAWLFLGFAICDGDLRPAYWTGIAAGWIGYRMTLSRLMRPIFAGFWKILTLPACFIKKFFAKLLVFLKNLFASGKKSSTIDKLKQPVKKGVRHDKA